MKKIEQTKDIRALNRRKVINTIIKQKQVSRAEISRITGLNKATVSTIVKEWLGHTVLKETQLGSSTGGRKPIMLTQTAEAGYCIAIDIGVTKIGIITTDLCNEIIEKHYIPIAGTEFVANYKLLYKYLDKLIEQLPPSAYGLIGIGLSVRGVVDLEGVIRSLPSLKWKNIDIKTLLNERYHVPVFVNNDGNLMALCEKENNPKCKNFAVLNLGDVISTGLIANGQLLRGHHGFANAIGHHTINMSEKEQCTCGKYGCLEQYCSNTAVINQMNKHLKNPIRNIEEFIAMVKMQDTIALKVLNQFIKNFAIGLDNIIFILDCELIIINSAIINALPYLLSEIHKNIVLPITQTQEIVLSQLGADTAITTASKLCIDNFYEVLSIED